MPAAKRKSTENDLPTVEELMKEVAPKGASANSSAKRVKTKNAPLTDITNSPAPAQVKAKANEKAASDSATPKAKKSTKKDTPKESTKKDASSKKKSGGDGGPPDISNVHLDGENDESVPIYDTPSEIRRKITLALQQPGMSKASLLRSFAESSPHPNQKISTTSLGTFTKAKGKFGGAQSKVWYVAYVYFEKVRIAQNKKKSKTRDEFEEAWGNKGIDRGQAEAASGTAKLWMHNDERLSVDKFGKVEFVRIR